jgi:hypothetical protein
MWQHVILMQQTSVWEVQQHQLKYNPEDMKSRNAEVQNAI